MSKYYVYHCVISVIDTEAGSVETVLEEHTEDTQVRLCKEDALKELRTILDAHSEDPLSKEIERLNRVVHALDTQLNHAATVPV